MRRTDFRTRSLPHRLAAVTLTALLTLAAIAGCSGREGQTTQPGQNENAIPGEATATSTSDTEYTEEGEGEADDEGAQPGEPSPPQTIIAPEPAEPAESEAEG